MAFGYRGDPAWRRRHPLARSIGDATNGAAEIPGPYRVLTVIFSDGEGWEHVSVSTPGRCPNWPEMRWLKDLFWSPEDTVMQLHPPASTYVNVHDHCLHLWRPVAVPIPVPPRGLV